MNTAEPKIRILDLPNFGDARGPSFTIPAEALSFVGQTRDVHMASTRNGAVRGNHYHLRRREALIVLPGSEWSLHWDNGDAASPQHRQFDGTSAVLVLIAPGASHAVRNDSDNTLWLVAMSSESFDPSETVARKVV